MRRSIPILIVMATWLGASSIAGASCAPPYLTVEGARSREGVEVVDRGVTVTIVGHGWKLDCNDTGGSCFRDDTEPMKGIQVRLVASSGDVTPIATVDADDGTGISIPGVTMPDAPGRYLLVARTSGIRGNTYTFPILIR